MLCRHTLFSLHVLSALADTLVSCFYELKLTKLAGLFEQYVDVETGSTQLTAFSPPNKAIKAKIRMLNGFSINDAVNSLFVGSPQPSSSLDDGNIFVSLAGLLLHITTLETPFSNETVSCLVISVKYISLVQ